MTPSAYENLGFVPDEVKQEPVQETETPKQTSSSSSYEDFGFVPDPPSKKKSTPNLVEKRDVKNEEIPTNFSEAVQQVSGQLTKPSSKPTEKSTEEVSSWQALSKVIDETTPAGGIGRGVYDLVRSAYSGVTDQLPKEYYVQRLRMSKGSFGDLFDPRSDLNAFGDKLPKEISRGEFARWNSQQDMGVRFKSYDDKAKLFLTEKLGKEGYEALKNDFAVSNTKERLAFEDEIQQQNKEAASKTGGMVQNVKDIKGASDLLSFTGNMVGQALYRAPVTLTTGPVGSIVAESATVYDTQLDLISQDKGISRKEVIAQGLDNPAAGQAASVLLGTIDAVSMLNVLGLFRKAAAGEIKKATIREFAEGFVKAAAPEAATELIQGEGEQMAAAYGAGTEYEFDPWRALTGAVGGFIGGGVLGGVSPLTPKAVAKQTEQVKSSSDVTKIEQVADTIQQQIDNTTDETVQTKTEPVTESVQQTGPSTQDTTPTDGGTTQLQEPGATDGLSGPTDSTVPDETTRKPSVRKKALESRAYEGATNPVVKEAIKKHGLAYQPESFEVGRIRAEEFITEVGIDEAVTAASLGEVEGSSAAYIFAKAIDLIEQDIQQTNDPEKIEELAEKQSDLVALFGTKAREGGRFISALQDVYANSDFNYNAQAQIDQYKSVNKGVIPENVEQQFRDLETRLKEANNRIVEFERQKQERDNKAAIEAIKKEAAKERAKRTKLIDDAKKKEISTFFDSLKVKDVSGTANDITRVVGAAVWNGSLEVVKTAVLAGADVANAVQAGIKYIEENFKGEGFNPEEYKSVIAPGVEQIVPKPKKESRAKVRDDGQLSIPNSLLVALVEGGADTIETLTQQAHQLIVAENPDVTERQVRDAITQYGKTKTLSKDQIKSKLRELKRVGRLISAMEDVKEGTRPLRSGLQRDKPTDQERRLQRELREAMKDLPMDDEETARTLKTALDQVKARLTNQISDLEEQIKSGKKTPKKKGIEYDDEAKALQQKRDDLRKILTEIEGKQGISDEQKIRNAIAAAQRSQQEYERRIKEKDFSQKKGSSTPVTAELQAARDARDAMKSEYDKLLKEAGVIDKKRMESAKKAVKKQIQEYERRIREKDFVKPEKNQIDPDDELLTLKAQKLAVKDEFDKLQYENELKNRTKTQKMIDGLIELWGITRALRATGEFSFILLQGGVQTISHPKAAWRAFKTAMQHFASEKKSKEFFQKLRAQEYYGRMKDSKLAITEPDAKMDAREEQFLGGWVNHIWDVLGLPVKVFSKNAYERFKQINPFKAVERAGIGYLDTLRISRYLQGEEMLRLQGKDFKTHSEDYKNMADVINTFTGRASLGKFEMISKPLSVIFFSPRNWASIIKQTTPYALYHFGKMTSVGKDGKVEISVAQKMAMADYMKYVGLTGAIIMLVAANQDDDDKDGWKVELDPRSSDFLKLKSGKTRVDPWGGRIQMIVYQSRLIAGSLKDGKGRVKELGEGMTSTRFGLTMKMVENKLAPSAAIVKKYMDSKEKKTKDGTIQVDSFGNPVGITDQLPANLYPIYWETIQELHKDQPMTVALFLDFLAFLGVGTQTYDTKKKEERIIRNFKARH